MSEDATPDPGDSWGPCSYCHGDHASEECSGAVEYFTDADRSDLRSWARRGRSNGYARLDPGVVVADGETISFAGSVLTLRVDADVEEFREQLHRASLLDARAAWNSYLDGYRGAVVGESHDSLRRAPRVDDGWWSDTRPRRPRQHLSVSGRTVDYYDRTSWAARGVHSSGPGCSSVQALALSVVGAVARGLLRLRDLVRRLKA